MKRKIQSIANQKQQVESDDDRAQHMRSSSPNENLNALSTSQTENASPKEQREGALHDGDSKDIEVYPKIHNQHIYKNTHPKKKRRLYKKKKVGGTKTANLSNLGQVGRTETFLKGGSTEAF